MKTWPCRVQILSVGGFVLLAMAPVAGMGAAPTPPKSSPTSSPPGPSTSGSDLKVLSVKAATGATHDNEVVAGDEAMIQLAGPWPPDAQPSVTIEGQSVVVTKTDQPDHRLEVRIPDELSRGDHPVVVSLTVQGSTRELQPRPTLSVFPPPNATVTDISPKRIEVGTPIKVSGTGFMAPKEQIVLQLGEVKTQAQRVAPDGTWFVTTIDETRETGGQKQAAVTVWGVPAGMPEQSQVTLARTVRPQLTWKIAAFALLPLAAVAMLISLLYHSARKRLPWLAALLLEPENQTYSLSRAQFFWWMTIIAYAYLFLFFARGIHEENWGFPPLSGFAYTLLISLGTLVAAQATSEVKGAKGAGLVHPAPADLIVHGGVLAPERVQQVAWTVIAGVGLLWITIKTYATATALPTIPDELLALMGISSAGYLTGKMARRPGPIITQVLPGLGSVALRIYGVHLSVDARVWVDGVELPRTAISTLESDPDHPNEFVKALKVTLSGEGGDAELREWLGQEHTLIVVNADAQRAEWQSELPRITSVDPAPAPEEGRRTLTIFGERIAPGATLEAPGVFETAPLTRDPAQVNRWTASVKEPAGGWPKGPVNVVVQNPSGERGAYPWTPPTS
jgi:hypothetical protein